ncbi:hypothetical protein EDB84DRAFT_1562355 [Lactarius hengduanensis]|nr:hypothetical protein EDB84DRAFT_1562355 [Lactarius hengduanensis]
MKEQSRRDYILELHEVADEADIVLVLDVHDLTGAARQLVEEEMRGCETEEKRLVFVFIKMMHKLRILKLLKLKTQEGREKL